MDEPTEISKEEFVEKAQSALYWLTKGCNDGEVEPEDVNAVEVIQSAFALIGEMEKRLQMVAGIAATPVTLYASAASVPMSGESETSDSPSEPQAPEGSSNDEVDPESTDGQDAPQIDAEGLP